MDSLKAARLLEHVVVIGGNYDGNPRDEASLDFYQLSDIYPCTKVLQYEETTGTWSEIGTMEKGRTGHAVIDLSLYCPGIVGQTNKKQLSSPPSSPPMFTIFSSLIPYPILHPISYHCFHNYRFWGLKMHALDYYHYDHHYHHHNSSHHHNLNCFNNLFH